MYLGGSYGAVPFYRLKMGIFKIEKIWVDLVRIDRTFQQVVRRFSTCWNVYSILIGALSFCGVLSHFSDGGVDYCVSLDVLLLNAKIWWRLAIIKHDVAFWSCGLVLGTSVGSARLLRV